MGDLLAADRWIYLRLTADPVVQAAVNGKVYYNAAPQEATYPLIAYSLVSAENVLGVSADIVMRTETWQVVIWDDAPTFSGIEPVAQAIINALHKQSAADVIGCVYAGTTRLTENEGDVEYRAISLEFEIYLE